MKDRESSLKEKYLKQVTPDTQAKRCVRCGKCEELCPQRLPIKKLLRSAVYIFESED
jgi:predicted aldo/keto reductase-like oxidoreductase